MRSVMAAGVAAIALTLGGCGMFGGKSGSSTSANDQPSAPSTNSTYSGTSRDNAQGAASSTPAAPSGTSAASSSKNVGSAHVREAQQELQSAGFYKGKIDGIDGRETRQALMSFQKENGLPQTGKLDQATMAQLQNGSSSGSGSSTPGARAPSDAPNSSSGTTTSPQQ
jgi:peptidoglycan hydrolase-like protein with peptidoglycan-binding domain